MKAWPVAGSLFAIGLMLTSIPEAGATSEALQVPVTGASVPLSTGTMELREMPEGVLRIRYLPPAEKPSEPTLVVDATSSPLAGEVETWGKGRPGTFSTRDMRADWDPSSQQLVIEDLARNTLLHIDIATLVDGRLSVSHAADDAMYGIGGTTAFDRHPGGLLRTGSQDAKAGAQGNAGAPFVWSTAGYGVLADAIGAHFDLAADRVTAQATSAPIRTVYVFVGPPPEIFSGLAQVSGHSAMFPKWAMGFTNSQWGIDQKELLSIVKTYRAKHIPIDNVTLDFDWKAWGDDHYGEFRWNETKFPDGSNGKLKQELDAQGVHLTGIMKPRVHIDTEEGRYATEHGLWVASSVPKADYFSLKTIREIDFGNPAARAWFFNDTLKHSFDTGIVGWWNDEADEINDTQFMNMQRALYEGQRAYSNQRVWSINRNFYLGSQRYAYGLWSGDIYTGFESMRAQRARMLAAIDVGAMQWGMDGGGFQGDKPSPENYARWIQFGAFTPIFRVHGSFGQKRQPWVYGEVAEKAAGDAIRLRCTLIPYIYAYEFSRHQTGIGLVRPLTFDWPDDAKVRDDVDAWMFGKYLLVSPVVEQGQTTKDVYLPAGTWIDFASGKVYRGGQVAHLAVDSKRWSDIPMFIRAGAIIPMQPVMNHVGETAVTQLNVEMFPSTTPTSFDLYDDDGLTYAYEKSVYSLRRLTLQREDTSVRVTLSKSSGSFNSPMASLILKVHGVKASKVEQGGKSLQPAAGLDDLQKGTGEGWVTGADRYGDVTYVRIATDAAKDVRIMDGGAHH